MKINPFYWALPLSIWLGCSCSSSIKKGELETIAVGSAYSALTTIKASDYFQHITYIPLETTDSVLVGNAPSIRLAGNRLIVSSAQKQCFSFNKSDGRFVASVGHIGNDPEGCRELTGWLDAENGYLYFSKGDGVSAVYDTEGNFIGTSKEVELSEGLFGIDSNDYLDKQIRVKHLPASATKPDRIVLYQDTTLLASFPSHGAEKAVFSGNPADIESIAVFQQALMGHSMIFIRYKSGEEQGIISTEHPFWHVGEKLYFREYFNDTIYQVTKEGLVPERRFDFGAMTWKREDRYDVQKDEAIYPLEVMENDRFLWLRFVVNLYRQDKRKAYNALYLKETGEVKVAAYEEGLENDLNGFLPLQPTFVTADGEFAQIIPAETIAEWFEEHPDAAELPKEVKALKEITAEDNPVVVLMK